MSSQAGSREDGRRLSLRTLGIASVASATAAVVTSLFWKGGTPIAAAVTPVIVAVVSELLHRPAEKIAGRFTAETDALPAEAAGGGPPPPPGRTPRQPPARDTEMKVYRTPPRRPRLRAKPIAVTAAAAFVIAAAILTLPELIAGQSFGSGDRDTTLFGGSGGGDSSSSEPDGQDTEQDGVPQPAPEQPQPEEESEPQSTPAEPPSQETTPEPRQSPTAPPPPAAPGEPAP